MKKILVILVPLVLYTQILVGQTTATASKKDRSTVDTSAALSPSTWDTRAQRLITTILLKLHYRNIDLNDSLSSEILDRYVKALDYNRMYFLASDIRRFERYRSTLDDNLKSGNLAPAFDIFNTFKVRVRERTGRIAEQLKKPMDFTADEYYEYNRENAQWAKTYAELDEVWRKALKNQELSLKLSGKAQDSIAQTLLNRFKNQHRRIEQYKTEDVFSLYMNALTTSVDPHTNYFSPMDSDNFKISMSLSFEGIGARLQAENEYTVVNEIIPGGPAFKNKQLKKGDKIIGVGQDETGQIADVIGWRLDDVVKLIRGPKGTTVRLQIIPADARPDAPGVIVKIVRDQVKLEEQAAKKSVISVQDNGKTYKIGVITVPTFYLDFEAYRRGAPDYKSTTRDVKKLIAELNRDKVNGIVIDLRNNGGGSLEEAIELTGLFIPAGPVVQVRKSDGGITVSEDEDPELVYDGPLAVLVNRFSASASEIFAAAIQDYKRGLIIGEQTYGKGTVQNLVDLNRYLHLSDRQFGQIKLTIAKFYRITGGSTQRRGVQPEITLPSATDLKKFGEDSERSALPWDQIKPVAFTPMNKIQSGIVTKLIQSHNKRVKTDTKYNELLEQIAEVKKRASETTVSLQEAKRKKERDEMDKKKGGKDKKSMVPGAEDADGDGEPDQGKKDEPDVLLNETAHILNDMVTAGKH